ncbi:MAG TPA: DUF2802 domain-containing protein [Rhodocyclaceae bacterium]|nr:DUF2802 domain-containing protein [Rhodocyclaceae bacterium]
MMEWLGIGWRDLVLLAAALIGVYLVLSVMRLFQVGMKRPAVTSASWQDAPAIESSIAPAAPPAPPEAHVPLTAPAAAKDKRKASPTNAAFAQELARSNLELEVQRLRKEDANLRNELTRLSEEVAQIKAARNISPLYSEAMSLAQQGVEAESIADQCGISMGEATLVAALARSADSLGGSGLSGYDSLGHYGGRDGRYTH